MEKKVFTALQLNMLFNNTPDGEGQWHMTDGKKDSFNITNQQIQEAKDAKHDHFVFVLMDDNKKGSEYADYETGETKERLRNNWKFGETFSRREKALDVQGLAEMFASVENNHTGEGSAMTALQSKISSFDPTKF